MEPWFDMLFRDRPAEAWDAFMDRYRRLIFATIRRVATNHDDVMDIFVFVCEALREDDMERLRRYAEQENHRGRFSTWLVAVVRNRTLDWLRRRDGRKRPGRVPADLTPLQQVIFQHVFQESRSHVETYELLSTGEYPDLTFRTFLSALNETCRAAPEKRPIPTLRDSTQVPLIETTETSPDSGTAEFDASGHMARALESLSPDDRLAVQLFVIDDLSAKDVARIVGWETPKTVYNRVFRALQSLRANLVRRGIGPDDL